MSMCLTFYLYFYPHKSILFVFFFCCLHLWVSIYAFSLPCCFLILWFFDSFIYLFFYSRILLFFLSFLGANLTMKSTQGLDPLHTALRIRDWNLLFLLLHYGAGEFRVHFVSFFSLYFSLFIFSLFYFFSLYFFEFCWQWCESILITSFYFLNLF